MNDIDKKLNFNEYRGNGWSMYQKLVLSQLDAHEKFLSNLADKCIKLEQTDKDNVNFANNNDKDIIFKIDRLGIAFTEMDKKMCSIDSTLKSIMDYENEKSLIFRLKVMESIYKDEEKSKIRTKAIWGFVGAVLVFIADATVHLVAAWFKHP